MKWSCLSLPALALLLSACSTTDTEVIRFGDNVWRAPSSADAARYCRDRSATLRTLGRAPAQSGVLFRCE